ncbi:MAG: hypothetical protein U0M42_01615 [Acutalibacteraceae bacterium]|nr:hypothetical protein [Acutalibacteraceae bacterium]
MKKFKIILKILCACFLSGAVFLSVIFLMTREELIGVDVPKTDQPYSENGFVPESACVLFVFPDSYGAVIELDFEKRFSSAVIIKEPSEHKAYEYGFAVQHTSICDYSFIMDFIDIIGGIELSEDTEVFRYTGVQVCNLLATYKDDIPLRARILEAVFLKISKYGLSNSALSCIIENTNTTLSVPACYGWVENMSEALNSYNILNER